MNENLTGAYDARPWAIMASRTVSTVFHPFLMPTYLLALLFFGRTAFALYSLRFKIYIAGVVLLYTLVIPALSVALLRLSGRISSLRLDKRDERILPLAICALCCIICAMTIRRIPSAILLRRIMLAAACCQILCLAVSRFWKISLHLTAAGGFVAVIAVLGFAGTGRLTTALAAAIVVSGMLASARLYLGEHNLRQVAAGFAGGFITAAVSLLLL